MSVNLVLNDLSYEPLADSVKNGQTRIEMLLDIIRKVNRRGSKATLRMREPINHMLLAAEYPISRWLNDSSVSQEIRTRYKSLLTQTPFLKPQEEHINDQTMLAEFQHEQTDAYALGMAYYLKGIALSFTSEPCWDTSAVKVLYQYLGENDDILAEDISINHASKVEHVDAHTDFIEWNIKQSQRTVRYLTAEKAVKLINDGASPDQWNIIFHDNFAHTWDKLDGPTRLNIYDAITDIQSDPLTPRGNTIKRLTGDLIGYWRYRLGDFRMPYMPDTAQKSITIMDYKPRGEVYS